MGLPTITLRDKRIGTDDFDPDTPTTSANCEILINGKPITGITGLTIKIEAPGIVRVDMTAIGHIEANIVGEFETQVFQVIKPGKDQPDEKK